jgi:oxaloacetate decarboxylase alpha subunit
LVAAFQEKQAAAAKTERVSTTTAGKSQSSNPLPLCPANADPEAHPACPPGSGTPLKAPLSATVGAFRVNVGDALDSVEVVVVLEAMKTEVAVAVPRAFRGKRVVSLAVAPGDIVKAGQALLYCD